MKPTLGRIVHYRSRTGTYTVAAVITATQDTLFRPGVEAGHVPDLDYSTNVHLTVFTPGKPGMRMGSTDFVAPSEHPISENVAGCYQEWNIPFWDGMPEEQPAGTWAWPPRV